MKYKVEILNNNYFKKPKEQLGENIFLDPYEKFIIKMFNLEKTRCNVQIKYNNEHLETIRLEAGKNYEMTMNPKTKSLFIFKENSLLSITFLPEKPGIDLSYKKLKGYATPICVDYDKSTNFTINLLNKNILSTLKLH